MTHLHKPPKETGNILRGGTILPINSLQSVNNAYHKARLEQTPTKTQVLLFRDLIKPEKYGHKATAFTSTSNLRSIPAFNPQLMVHAPF